MFVKKSMKSFFLFTSCRFLTAFYRSDSKFFCLFLRLKGILVNFFQSTKTYPPTNLHFSYVLKQWMCRKSWQTAAMRLEKLKYCTLSLIELSKYWIYFKLLQNADDTYIRCEFLLLSLMRDVLIVITDEGRNPETGWLRSYLV